ncbi:MAG: ROK family protein [Anaerolineaceae bacterium]|nr:ROK family protein [Anaerolineaceae bacterium]
MSDVIGAVDIGGTKIAVGLIATSGEVLAETRWETDPQGDPVVGAGHIADVLQQLANENECQLFGVGIGLTGRLDPINGVMAQNAFLPEWSGFSLADHLTQLVGCPVFIENDADAAALGEFCWGAGQGARSLIYVTVSTGIGAGVILNGQLYRGAGGAHPEIGHHVISEHGPLCYCGARGCWQEMASGTAMAHRYVESHPDQPLNAAEICHMAKNGDVSAMQAVKEEAHYLGLGLANLITLFLPERIVLGGGVMESFELFEPGMMTVIRAQCGMVPHERVQILPAQMRGGAGLVGAGAVFLHRAEKLNDMGERQR